jgi:hypothetical protein
MVEVVINRGDSDTLIVSVMNIVKMNTSIAIHFLAMRPFKSWLIETFSKQKLHQQKPAGMYNTCQVVL